MELIHQKHIEIKPGHCDANGKIKIPQLLDFLQIAAGEHADMLHFGIEDLNRENETWVLSRLRVETNRLPVEGETVILKTWPKGIEKLFAKRDFLILENEGNAIVRAASYWLIVDRITMRPKSIRSFFTGINYPKLSAVDEKLKKIPSFTKRLYTSEIKTTEKEIDINGHINNVWYAKWFINAIPQEIINEKNITSFELNYLAEVFANETLNVEIGNTDNDTTLLLGSIKRNNREVCRAEIHFG
jgi:acyl-ACP thioesterase